MDMLSGNVVKPKAESQSAAAGLQAMLSFLAQGAQAPQQQEQGRPVDTGLIQMLMQHGAQQTEQDQADQGAALRQQLMGQVGEDRVPTPLLGAHDATEGSGFLGGKLTPQQVMAGLLGSKDKSTANFGAQMLNDQFAPKAPAQPHYMEMGVPGKEGYRVNAMMTPNGPQAIGEPWKPSSGVSVNVGDKLPPPSPGYMWNKEATSQSYIPGGPADPENKQPTQSEDTSTKFGTGMMQAGDRMDEALKVYDLEKSSMTDRTARVLGDGFGDIGSQISNAIKSPDRRALDQATAEFRQFALTAMTGAAYSQDQKDDILRGMIPTDSDDAKTKARKLEARNNFTHSMLQSGLPITKRDAAQSGPASWPRKIPTGWNDQLEAEYLREHPEGK
jgi:hypothetical protein